MTGIDWLSVVFGGLGVLMIALSPFVKSAGGYQRPLDPFGPAPLAEREFSRHEAAYNRNPRAGTVKGGIAFIILAVLLQFFKVS
jgi:hypothetical protein